MMRCAVENFHARYAKTCISRARITGYTKAGLIKTSPSLPPVFSQMYARFRVHLGDGLLTLEGTLRIRKISPPMRAVHGIMPGGNYAPHPNVVVTKSARTRKTFR